MGKDKGSKGKSSKGKASDTSVRDRYRVDPGFDLAGVDPDHVEHGPDDKESALAACRAMEQEASDLHEQLWATAKRGGSRAVLICLQGMDTAGKGGATKAVDRLLDPLGFSVRGFGPPTDEEKSHDFLWRHERALPEPGRIRLWDRSHYESVLIERVRGFAEEPVWRARYEQINEWEADLADRGVTVLKFMLHISGDEQKQRLLDRLADPTKHWKYNPGDVDERALWDDYQAAYADALTRCSTSIAPWYCVPANHKWHRDWIISTVLVETLRDLGLGYPSADFDVATEQARVARS